MEPILDIIYCEDFLADPNTLYAELVETVVWDRRLRARLTASFGVPYNYSGMTYPEVPLPPQLQSLAAAVHHRLGYEPNNCLVNFYPDGSSTMGFHSDSIAELAADTGIAIVSLGADRALRFKNIANPDIVRDYRLANGSLLSMSQNVQRDWKHAVPAAEDCGGRISLTFRNLRPLS